MLQEGKEMLHALTLFKSLDNYGGRFGVSLQKLFFFQYIYLTTKSLLQSYLK